MASAFSVVRAGIDDLEQLVPLFDGYRQFYQQPSDEASARAFLLERLRNGESVIFLARAGQAALGFTQLYPSFSSVSLRRLWILNDLFVAPAARGGGVATALLDRAAAWARETGARGLVLETGAANLTAQRLYEHKGWRRDESFHYFLEV